MEDLEVWARELLFGKEKPIPCPSLPHPPTLSGGSPTLSGGSRSFVEDNNGFALAMYRQLRQQPGNLFFSPFSIRTALGMTFAGARGETASQMRDALCISSLDETLHVTLAETIQRLNACSHGNYEMVVANSLWGQEGSPFQPEFLDLIAQHYRGAMNFVDFRYRTEATRVTINQWVEDKTRRKIQELIPLGSLKTDTRLALVNAIYFKGMWMQQFPKVATSVKPFHLEDGRKVETPLMYQQEEFRCLQAGGYQAVELAYRGGDLSMLVLLPDRKDGLRDLEKTLSPRMLQDCVAQMGTCEIKLYLPRFKITWGTVNLNDHLTVLGMPLAFTRGQANFSGINGHEPPHEDSLFISAVFHKAFVATNEEGTEAAAATAIADYVLDVPPPVPTFCADHPFLFVIRDRKSGAILFLGRMADPSRES